MEKELSDVIPPRQNVFVFPQKNNLLKCLKWREVEIGSSIFVLF